MVGQFAKKNNKITEEVFQIQCVLQDIDTNSIKDGFVRAAVEELKKKYGAPNAYVKQAVLQQSKSTPSLGRIREETERLINVALDSVAEIKKPNPLENEDEKNNYFYIFLGDKRLLKFHTLYTLLVNDQAQRDKFNEDHILHPLELLKRQKEQLNEKNRSQEDEFNERLAQAEARADAAEKNANTLENDVKEANERADQAERMADSAEGRVTIAEAKASIAEID